MKKQLLFGSLALFTLLTGHSFGQSKAGSASAEPAGAYNTVNTGKGTQAVITTTTSTCMSINLPAPATWSLVNYGVGTPIFSSGFVSGPNTYGDKEKAMYFDASSSANTMITQVYVGFDHAYTATPSKTVGIKVYDGTGGTVGAALGSNTISMSTIMTDVSNNQYSLIIFPTPINLPASKKFFVSVDISSLVWTSGTKDSLSIVSNTSPQTNPGAAWEKDVTNVWASYATDWSLNVSLLIHPFLTQAPLTASITSTPGNTICSGQSVNYSAAGSTAGTYEWYFNSAFTASATGVSTSYGYPSSGTYTTYLIVTDACGSLKLGQTLINVLPSPTVNATPSATTVCNGANVTLTGGGASSYAWSGGITNATPFAATSSANYTVTGTAVNGCTNSAVSAVVVLPNPTVTANASSTLVCSGNTLALTGGGASTYTWSGGVSNAVAFVPSSGGTYTVTATAANSCTGTAMVSVSLAPNPTVSATPASTTVCSGDMLTLSGSGATTYTWTGGVSNGVAFAASSSTNYTVTGSDANGCKSTAVSNVSVNPNPVIASTPASTMICNGGNVVFNGTGALSYTWTGGISDGVPFTPTASASYTVTGTDVNGCKGTAVASLSVNPNPSVTATPSSTTICSGSSVVLNGGGAVGYSWTGGVTNGSAFTPTASNSYTVTGTDANGCTGTAIASVSVSACTGIKQASADNLLSIYPNPNNGEFVVAVPSLTASFIVEVYNSLGQKVHSENITSEKQLIKTDMPSGIYFVQLIEANKVVATKKLICK